MRNSDDRFFKFLSDIRNLKGKADSDYYKELVGYFKDGESGLRSLLNHACSRSQRTLRALENGQSYYDAPPAHDASLPSISWQVVNDGYSNVLQSRYPDNPPPYPYSITRRSDNGQLALIIRKEDHSYPHTSSDNPKSGEQSLLIDHQGIKPFFTLASFGEKHIPTLKTELAVINKIKSPFIQRPLPGTERKTEKGQRRLSISSPRAKSKGKAASFNSLEDCLLAVKCLALGLKDISDANYVHQDIKPKNILILPSGILQIIGLKLPTFGGKGEHLSSAGCIAPEILVDIITEQREVLLKVCRDNREYCALLLNHKRSSIEQQIKAIKQILHESGITATSRFHYNFIENYPLNKEVILWYQNVKTCKDQKPGRLLPDPKQDVWSLGATVLKLTENLPESLRDHDHIRALGSLINNQVLQPPNSRIDINKFIVELDKLMKKTGLTKKIQKRIVKHIHISTPLNVKETALKLDGYRREIDKELKQESTIFQSMRSFFFPDRDKRRKKKVAAELRNVLTKQRQSPKEKREEVSTLIRKNIGLFSNGRLKQIALEVSPEYREGLQPLSDKLGL